MRFGPLTGWLGLGQATSQRFRGWSVYADRDEVPSGLVPRRVAIVELDRWWSRLLMWLVS